MTSKILKTQNEEHGFWGTTAIHYSEKQTQKRWNDVFKTLLELSGLESENIRELLDDRIGRHLADQCYKEKDVKQVTKECYFNWLEKYLFNEDDKPIETDKSTVLFGTKVRNRITNSTDIVLYTYKNKNRIYQDYAVCINKELKKYRISMDHIEPIEE